MRKLLYGVVAVVLALAAVAAFMYYTAAGQDTLFRQAAGALANAAPPLPNGLRVVVCGSASP
ncbi:MAG: hypothetical protein OXH37_05495, partial [Gammaproteobacteria bacterium]|nr:hypothetical protein [Gammaproteobacteria bacterium]